MSEQVKPTRAQQSVTYASPQAAAAESSTPFEPKPPLEPHKRLFIGLMLIFAGWVGVLLWLFFTTVWPLRHSLTATHPALP